MTEDNLETNIATRHTVETLYSLKLDLLRKMDLFESMDRDIVASLMALKSYSPYYITNKCQFRGDDRNEKYVDRIIWKYIVDLFFLHRYMLCTEYEKLQQDIENGNTPRFTVENARAWLEGLSELINDNVKTLIHQVFAEITQGHYYTGRICKKRNNNGIDKNFILYTNDYSSLFGYWTSKPTVTDDIEKVCYILAGQAMPKLTAKDSMRNDKAMKYGCEHFTLTVHQNGNSHYALAEPIREKLNLYGPQGAIIGENIKIKIVSPHFWG